MKIKTCKVSDKILDNYKEFCKTNLILSDLFEDPTPELVNEFLLKEPERELWTKLTLIPYMGDGWVYIYPQYMVSSSGNLFSLVSKRILKRHEFGKYQTFHLSVTIEHQLNPLVHRAIYTSFFNKIQTEICISKLTINHKDGDGKNNFLPNLELMTNLENTRDRSDRLGSAHPNGTKQIKIKLVEDYKDLKKGECFYIPKSYHLADFKLPRQNLLALARGNKTYGPFLLSFTDQHIPESYSTPLKIIKLLREHSQKYKSKPIKITNVNNKKFKIGTTWGLEKRSYLNKYGISVGKVKTKMRSGNLFHGFLFEYGDIEGLLNPPLGFI